jgi:hypothetical protein
MSGFLTIDAIDGPGFPSLRIIEQRNIARSGNMIDSKLPWSPHIDDAGGVRDLGEASRGNRLPGGSEFPGPGFMRSAGQLRLLPGKIGPSGPEYTFSRRPGAIPGVVMKKPEHPPHGS